MLNCLSNKLPKLDVVGSSPIARSMPAIFSCIPPPTVLYKIPSSFCGVEEWACAHFFFDETGGCFGKPRAAESIVHTYEESIWRLAEPILAEAGLELVCVECLRMKTRWLVRIYMDAERGITLGDCEAMSGPIGDILAVHDLPPGSYTLEVSSPGLDRPLVRMRDLLRFRGENVEVRLREKVDGVKSVRGRLVDVREEAGGRVLLVEAGGRTISLPWDKVARARLAGDAPGSGPRST